MIVFIGSTLLLYATLIFSPLIFTALLLDTSLLLGPANFGRAATKRIPRRSGWSTMMHIF
jgi:hypothetical protein